VFDRGFAEGEKWDIKDPKVGIGSVDAAATIGPATIFGEYAVSGLTPAFNAGIILEWSPTVFASMLYRDYPAEFVSPHANGFGDAGISANERGAYFGCDVCMLPWLRIRTSLDTWKSPWRTTFDPLPVAATELSIGCEVDLPRVATVLLQYRRKDRETTQFGRDLLQRDVRETLTSRKERVRVGAEVPVGRGVRLRARLEGNPVKGSKDRGELLSQEISWSMSASMTATLHLTFFDAPSYAAALFECERDLPGVYTSPALYGKGRRWYFVLRGSVLKSVRLSSKFATTHCNGETSPHLPSQVNDERSLSFQLDITL
jgi:hypothetical protein